MIALAAFALGLILGSFLNVCIRRWPIDQSIVAPRSHCPNCGQQINWYDNIPLFSYFLLGRKCRACGAAISWQYPVVEFLNGVLYAYIFAIHGIEPLAFKMALFASMMLVLLFADLNEYILPDQITLGGTAIGIGLATIIPIEPGFTQLLWWAAGVEPASWLASLSASAFSAALLSGMLYLLGAVYFRVRKIEGLGFGDVKMVAMIGAFWGLGPALFVLVIGSLLGAVVGLVVIGVSRKGWQHPLPFGTFLAVAAILVNVLSDQLGAWYFGLASAS